MKNLYKLIGIIVLGLFLNGCGTYYISSEYSDPIYDENYIPLEQVDSEEELDWTINFHFFSNRFNRHWYDWEWRWYNAYSYGWTWDSFWYGGHSYWSPWNQYPGYGNWGSSYWYWHQWHNPWHYSYYYGPRTNYLGNVYGWRHSNRNSLVYSNSSRLINLDGSTSVGRTYFPTNNNSNIANEINSRPNRPNRPVKPTNSNVIIINNNNSKPNNSSSRPIYTKPTNTNTNTNWNSSRPNNNNNYRPSNNSNNRPVFNNNTSRPSAPKNNSKSNRSGRNPR